MTLNVNEIYRLAGKNMMGVAMRRLRECKDEVPYELQNRYDNVEMLIRQYYTYEDKLMEDKVRSALLELADDMQESFAEKAALKYEYSIKRNWRISNETLIETLSEDYDSSDGITVDLDMDCILLFRQVWLSGKLDSNAMDALRDFVMSDSHEFASKIAVWAMMLKCIRHYDIRIVKILMECKMAECYVALMMIAMACLRRIDCDKVSLKLFIDFLQDEENAERLLLVSNNVMRTFETQNIANEMRDKIIPIVKEHGQQIGEQNGKMQLFDENGLNPLWEERLEESGIIDKMRKINDMQFKGADIHYESFKTMKSNPFFLEISHWFFPFDMSFHMLDEMQSEDDDLLGNIPKMLNMCDSDRYSLFLMMNGMGVGGLKGALSRLGLSSIDEVREQLGGDEKWKETARRSFDDEVKFAVMNLYRFYNLAPNHSDIISPFARVMPAEGSNLFMNIVPFKMKYDAANLLFKARQWELAYVFYSSCQSYGSEDDLQYQKMGYCCEKMQRWKEAVDEYGKSDVIVPDDEWTLRHSAYCYMQMGDSEMAAAMYRKVLKLNKESVNVLEKLTDIYLESEDYYAEALPLLYELVYKRGNMDDSRKLGFCLFMTGKKEESVKYLDNACQCSGASSREYMMRAIASGDEAHVSEACAIIYDLSAIMETISTGDVKVMIDKLDENDREKIESTLNKIILEQ